MRVLHIINGEFYSGAEKVQDVLAQRLPDFGYQVGFACLKPELFPRVRESNETPLTEIRMRSKIDFACCFDLAACVRQGHYSIIHTHTPRACLMGRMASALANVPMVHHLHSPTISDTEDKLRNLVNALIERLSLVGIRHVIAVSESVKRYLVRLKFPRDCIFVVHNGVPGRAKPGRRSVPDGKWVVGVVGLFRPRKGLEVLLRALAHLKEKGFSFRLIAVGPFETTAYESTIKLLAERIGIGERIEWVGFTEDVNSEWTRMDILVLPSLFGEGLPMVIIEAMAAGVPVVASSVGGVKEVIRDGREGLLVRPGDPIDLARALELIISGDKDWQHLRHSGQKRHAEAFSDYIMAQGISRIYGKTLQ
jgi:glycosyltransferase involved in cell wall biosynthesis